MFAFPPRKEIVVRVLLVAAILLSAPMNSFAVRAAEETATPTPTLTDTPTTETTLTPTETTPGTTESPIPAIETPTPTVLPVETASVDVDESNTASVASTTPTLLLSSEPNFIPSSGTFTVIWTIEGISYNGLVLQISLPDGTSPHGEYQGTYDETSHTTPY